MGGALSEVLSAGPREVVGIDVDTPPRVRNRDERKGCTMHVCFPYSDAFIGDVRKYREELQPKHTVVHSTVPVGTCSILVATHSPVVGLHPNLEESLMTFRKFVGGPDASEVAEEFRRCGMRVVVTDKSETTELLKLMCTAYYGLMVEFTKDVKRLCTKLGVPFEVWQLWNENYTEGYRTLGHKYDRPELQPIMTEMGGHCVIPNLDLIDTRFTRFLREVVEDAR